MKPVCPVCPYCKIEMELASLVSTYHHHAETESIIYHDRLYFRLPFVCPNCGRIEMFISSTRDGRPHNNDYDNLYN